MQLKFILGARLGSLQARQLNLLNVVLNYEMIATAFPRPLYSGIPWPLGRLFSSAFSSIDEIN